MRSAYTIAPAAGGARHQQNRRARRWDQGREDAALRGLHNADAWLALSRGAQRPRRRTATVSHESPELIRFSGKSSRGDSASPRTAGRSSPGTRAQPAHAAGDST